MTGTTDKKEQRLTYVHSADKFLSLVSCLNRTDKFHHFAVKKEFKVQNITINSRLPCTSKPKLFVVTVIIVVPSRHSGIKDELCLVISFYHKSSFEIK